MGVDVIGMGWWGGREGQGGAALLDPPPGGRPPGPLPLRAKVKGSKGQPLAGVQGAAPPGLSFPPLRPILIAFLLILAVAGRARALESPSEMLANPVLEKRAEAIGMQLRCVVCQNESIEQSNASLAKQFRGIIRRRVLDGWSNKRIIAWMVHRYGTFVLLRPPFDPMTWVLWGAPVIAVAAGGVSIWVFRRRGVPAPVPLSPEEHRALAELE